MRSHLRGSTGSPHAARTRPDHASSGPKESGHRPAIDPLLRSAAGAYGERVIAVILSGTLDDGSNGLRLVRRHGGSAMVQDPVEALFWMPLNAIDWAKPQHVAPVAGSRD